MKPLRVAMVADIHNGYDLYDSLGSRAPNLLADFRRAVNQKPPDFVMDLGDRIRATNAEGARNLLTAVKSEFDRIDAPVHSILGNADLYHLSPQDNAQILGAPAQSYSMDVGAYHFVCWNAPLDRDWSGLHMNETDLRWLADDLDKAAKAGTPSVVFSHVPLDNDLHDDEEALRISAARGRPGLNMFYYPEAHYIRDVLRDSTAILAFAGHKHEPRHRRIGGVDYFTQQSLSQARQPGETQAGGTWSMLELSGNQVSVTVHGAATPPRYELVSRYPAG